ncbi:hypothetical protein M8C21_012995 [Ambrosia artemisiifolia]|uniref:Uncharacterized protein n=1 Tax=Ambrosia artemisiifolia TaxID=4212 RepID=A0AAD5CVH0_AMBAR|nr:hypothetical protein M8C21_012995 [Ambrosia artemisiifolia]
MAMVDSSLPSRLKEPSQEAFIYICIVSIRYYSIRESVAVFEVYFILLNLDLTTTFAVTGATVSICPQFMFQVTMYMAVCIKID